MLTHASQTFLIYGTIVEYSQSICRIFGVHKQAVTKNVMKQLVTPRCFQECYQNMKLFALLGRTLQRGEWDFFRRIRRMQTCCLVLITFTVLWTSGCKICYVLSQESGDIYMWRFVWFIHHWGSVFSNCSALWLRYLYVSYARRLVWFMDFFGLLQMGRC